MKKLVCPVGVFNVDRTRFYRYRRRRVYNWQVRLFHLDTLVWKSKTYPCWKFECIIEQHLPYNHSSIIHAKNYAHEHPQECFFSYSFPSKFARRSELLQSLEFDINTPNYVLIDRLQESGLPVTNIRGDSKLF